MVRCWGTGARATSRTDLTPMLSPVRPPDTFFAVRLPSPGSDSNPISCPSRTKLKAFSENCSAERRDFFTRLPMPPFLRLLLLLPIRLRLPMPPNRATIGFPELPITWRRFSRYCSLKLRTLRFDLVFLMSEIQTAI